MAAILLLPYFYFLVGTVLGGRSEIKPKFDLSASNYGNALTEAINDIIEKFYAERTDLLNIFWASEENAPGNVYTSMDMLSEIIDKIKTVELQIEIYHDLKVTSEKVYNIFFIDSKASFWEIFKKMTPEFFDYQGYYLIVLTNYSSKQYEIMTNIFEQLWSEYVINVNIIFLTPENDNEAIMMTYFPYTAFFCGRAYPIQLNQYRSGKWLHKNDLFPLKVSNMYGCQLTVATVQTPPFMIIGDNNGTLVPNGIDGVLLRVLSQKMNFTVDLRKLNTQGTVYENGSTSGAYNMVIGKKANFTLGFISSTLVRDTYMKPSYIYYTCNLVWIVPPGRLLTSLEKLMKPFKKILWICVISVLILGSIAIAIVNFQATYIKHFILGYKNKSPHLNLYNIFFGGALVKLPRNNFARFLLALFSIYCLIIRSSYTGALFKFMKEESREPISNDIDNMIQRNYKFHVLESSSEYISGVPVVSGRAKFIRRNEIQSVYNELQEESFKGVLLSSEEHVAYLNGQRKYFFNHAEEIFFSLNLCIYSHLQSCLTEQFNSYILKFINGGFVQKWAKEFVDKTYLKPKSSDEPKVLVNYQLYGAYELLLFGFVLSFTVFIFEIFSARCKTVK